MNIDFVKYMQNRRFASLQLCTLKASRDRREFARLTEDGGEERRGGKKNFCILKTFKTFLY